MPIVAPAWKEVVYLDKAASLLREEHVAGTLWHAELPPGTLGGGGRLEQRVRRIGNDLPYHPFFTEKKPREHLALAARQLVRLTWAMKEKPPWDDPACTVALISHAIPEAREGLSAYKKERLYRGLFE